MKKESRGNIRFIHIENIEDFELVCGQEVSNTFPIHLHKKYCVGVIDKGTALYTCKDKEISLGPGSIYFINPNVPHQIKPLDKEGFSHLVMCFGDRFVSNYLSGEETKEKSLSFNTTHVRNLNMCETVKEFVHKVSMTKQYDQEYCLLQIFSELYQYFNFSSKVYDVQNKEAILRVAGQLEQRTGEQLSLQDMANLAGLSKFHFLRLFKEKVGISPYDYQLQLKVKLAKEMLAHGNSAAIVAVELGFFDQSHFSRFFKRNTGVSPGNFVKYNLKL